MTRTEVESRGRRGRKALKIRRLKAPGVLVKVVSKWKSWRAVEGAVPGLAFRRRDHHAVALAGEVAVPRGHRAGGAAAEPAVPPCALGMAAGEAGRGAEPARVPHHAQLAGPEARSVQHQPQCPWREMRQV